MPKLFKSLTKFELFLWIFSIMGVLLSSVLAKSSDVFSVIASLIGVTALIFVAKGYVIGQILTVVFAVFYGVISFGYRYYGEVITYLFMSAPIAAASAVSWFLHPYKKTKEVRVGTLSKKDVSLLIVLTCLVTVIFYFVLAALDNRNLAVSTFSVTTSFAASYLTFLRSPFYALAYAANDIVLIILWILAAIADPSYLPMIICFFMFLANDLYGFYNWQRMKKRQRG